ncbi:MAG: hypothetical protein PVJ39_12800 [Gammaproteobacteria bacterium]|jgi:hypothetical protein
MDNTVNRITRIVFGSTLIGIALVVSAAPLGGYALLPLIAIPVILSGIFGENLIGELLAAPAQSVKSGMNRYAAKLSKRTRRNPVTV